MPKLGKRTDLPKVSKNKKVGSFLTCPNQQYHYQFWAAHRQQIIYIFSHAEARNIKFGQQINLIQRVLLGILFQEALTSFPHIHMTLTNLFIPSQRGYCYQVWAVNAASLKSIEHFSIRVSNVIKRKLRCLSCHQLRLYN